MHKHHISEPFIYRDRRRCKVARNSVQQAAGQFVSVRIVDRQAVIEGYRGIGSAFRLHPSPRRVTKLKKTTLTRLPATALTEGVLCPWLAKSRAPTTDAHHADGAFFDLI